MKYVIIKRKKSINLLFALLSVSAVIIYAHENGIVERTLKNGNGCTCHNDFPSAGVLVVIAGPDTLAVNQTATYTVTISGGPLVRGGTNIAASNGNVLPVSGDLRQEANELTHVSPKTPVAGQVTFQFTYTAPATVGSQTLFANGNSVNFNGANSGDQWNFAANKLINVVQPTDIVDDILVNSFQLNQNYPNPFNPSTKISWQSPVSNWQVLKVFDVLGDEVATLVDEWKEAGNYSINFDASNLPSGVYVYRLMTGNFVETKKMMLLR